MMVVWETERRRARARALVRVGVRGKEKRRSQARMKSRYVGGSAGDPGCQIPVTRKEPVSPPDGMEMD